MESGLPFPDIRGHKYELEILRCHDAGLVKGREDPNHPDAPDTQRKFDPDAPMLRGEACEMFARLLDKLSVFLSRPI